ITSPGGSPTGSLRHGVRRLSWLFSDHVKPVLRSDAAKPNVGWATTLTHGAGGIIPRLPCTRMTYSLPPPAKPPIPLNSSRPAGGVRFDDVGPSWLGLPVRISSGSRE